MNLVGKFFKRDGEFGVIIQIHHQLYFQYDNDVDYDDIEAITDENFEIIDDYKLQFIKTKI